MTIKTRFAPSPTGYLHVGGARTALFSWLHARKHSGKFVLRIEDTDRERSSQESVNAILEGMAWLGLDYDEGPFYQTDNFDRYNEILEQLLKEGNAYHCYCTKDELDSRREEQMANREKPRYDGRCRHRSEPRDGIPPVIRFKNPQEGDVVVKDLIRGDVVFNNRELDDLIIARSDGTPTYNLTVVVDDMDMGVNCVIRGDDHLNNSPRQINILSALGIEAPQYAHVPMILGSDGKRLSKRHGAVSVMQYKEDGFLPEALLNYLVRLGWSYGDREIFSIDEMVELFSVEDVNKAASSFNTEKLLWINQEYIKRSSPAHLARHLSSHLADVDVDLAAGPDIHEVIEIHKERVKTLKELAQSIVYFYKDFDEFDAKAAKKNFKESALGALKEMYAEYECLDGWKAADIHNVITTVSEKLGTKMGKVAQPLRVAITGGAVSPSIDITAELIGRDRVVKRIGKAIEYIESSLES